MAKTMYNAVSSLQYGFRRGPVVQQDWSGIPPVDPRLCPVKPMGGHLNGWSKHLPEQLVSYHPEMP